MSNLTEYREPDAGDSPAGEAPVRRRPGPLRRIGCGLALVIWFLLMMTPCLLFVLATQGEIRLALGSAPGQELRVWLIMEDFERGLGVSTPGMVSNGDSLCVQTNVRYLLWAGHSDPLSYCDCYTRDADQWIRGETVTGSCGAE